MIRQCDLYRPLLTIQNVKVIIVLLPLMKIKLRIQTIYEPHPSKCRDLAVWDRFALIRELRNHRDGSILVPLDCYLGMALEETTVGKADSRHNIRIVFGVTFIL